MGVFPIRSGRPLDISVQRLQYTDSRVHHEVTPFGGTDECFRRGLPFWRVMLLGSVVM